MTKRYLHYTSVVSSKAKKGIDSWKEVRVLGLALAHQLTELLGGTLTVDSVWKRGSVFTITIPGVQQRQGIRAREEEIVLESLDDPQFSVTVMAKKLGYSSRHLSRVLRKLTGLSPVLYLGASAAESPSADGKPAICYGIRGAL